MGLDMYLSEKESKKHVAYWRKSNQIHNWFVNKIQDGKDDCEEYDVKLHELKELYSTCYNVLKRKDDDYSELVLPTKSGFFFGSTDYDDSYYDDIDSTMKMLSDYVNNEEYDDDFKFVYSSSW